MAVVSASQGTSSTWTTCLSYSQSFKTLYNPKDEYIFINTLLMEYLPVSWAELLSRYSDWRRAGGSGDRIPVGRDFPSVQTGPGAHPASCTMGTESFPGVKSGRGVPLSTHPLLVPWSWKGIAIHLPTLWATTGPVSGTLYLFIFLYPVLHIHFAIEVTPIMLTWIHASSCLTILFSFWQASKIENAGRS